MSHDAGAPRWSSGPMTQSQVHLGRISAEEVQLPRQSKRANVALSMHSYFFLVEPPLTIFFDDGANLAPFSRAP